MLTDDLYRSHILYKQPKIFYTSSMSSLLFEHLEGDPSGIRIDAVVDAWDANASTRLAELQTGDPSYAHLTDLMVSYIGKEKPGAQRIIDAGCGLGFLALELARQGHEVIGLDPSKESIELAEATHPTMPNLRFFNCTLREYAAAHRDEKADVIVANMVLNSVTTLPAFMEAAASLLANDGHLLATIAPSEYLHRKGAGLETCEPEVFKRAFAIRGRDPHPEPVYFFHYPLKYIDEAARASSLVITHTSMVKNPVTLRSDDIRFLRFQPGEVTPW